MLKTIKEFKKYVIVTGFKNVKIKDIEDFVKKATKEKELNIEIQFFDAKKVATWEHLYFAAFNALMAFKNARNISKSIAMETMLYASAQRQIRKAVNIIGIKPTTSEIALLIIGENPEKVKSALSKISSNLNATDDDAVLEFSEEKKKIIQKTFGISDSELKAVMKKDCLEHALVNLLIERMALLAVQR